jgi:hypothetical protein
MGIGDAVRMLTGRYYGMLQADGASGRNVQPRLGRRILASRSHPIWPLKSDP